MKQTEEIYRVTFFLKYGSDIALSNLNEALDSIEPFKTTFMRVDKRSKKRWKHKVYHASIEWCEQQEAYVLSAIVSPDSEEEDSQVIRACGSLIEWVYRYQTEQCKKEFLISATIAKVQ